MTDNDARFRMSVYEEHKLDCVGCCEPIDWHSFKKIWAKNNGQWMDAFLEAARLADKKMASQVGTLNDLT